MAEVSLVEQIIFVEREIRMRRLVFPVWIREGRMTQENANWEIEVMSAVHETLQKLQAGSAVDA